MNKAETGINTPAELDLREVRSEQLSALADGQLHGDEFAAALAWVNQRHNRLHVRLLEVRAPAQPPVFWADGFAAKRMNRNIQRALTGQSIDQIA